MNMLGKLFKYFFNDNYRFQINSSFGFYDNMSDEEYLKKRFLIKMGKPLNLESPKTFNEKLQWLKLYDRNPIYTTMVDKYEVRKYVADKIGEKYLIPLLGVWDNPDDIDFDKLPDKFVLKCNHNSGLGMCICKDKSKLDTNKVKKDLKKGLKQEYYLTGREWPYKDVKRKIICEKYMEDSTCKELRDYKFFCFNGKVKCFKIDFDRFIYHRANYYNLKCELMPFGETICPPDFEKHINPPINLDKMIKLAEILSEDKVFLRVDFYEVEGEIYFGELTFFPSSGFGGFEPAEWDIKIGEMLNLNLTKTGLQDEKT